MINNYVSIIPWGIPQVKVQLFLRTSLTAHLSTPWSWCKHMSTLFCLFFSNGVFYNFPQSNLYCPRLQPDCLDAFNPCSYKWCLRGEMFLHTRHRVPLLLLAKNTGLGLSYWIEDLNRTERTHCSNVAIKRSSVKITHREHKAKIGIRRSQQYSRTQYIQRYTDRCSRCFDQRKLLRKKIVKR